MNKNDRILVVGLGLMGGSYAMGLSKRGYAVSAIDVNPKSLEWAQARNLIAAGALSGSENAVRLIQNADYIILGLYPADIVGWLQANKQYFKKNVVITDLAGVKGAFLEQAQETLGTNAEFIATHPMAGRELSGVQNATDAMFFGANFLIIPTAKNTDAGLDFANHLAQVLGFGRITELSVAQHDKMIGYVSQLTHVIAVSLMNANNDPLLPAVTGDSFRDLTRIADINENLWSELFLENAPVLIDEIDMFIAEMERVRHALENGEKETLQGLLRSSTQRRRQFGKR